MMNNKYLEIIMENIIDCILTMKSGEQIEYRGLFEAWVWSTIPAADRRHFIGPSMSLLVRQREMPFDFAFLDRKRYNPSKSLAPPQRKGELFYYRVVSYPRNDNSLSNVSYRSSTPRN